jgi:hypothetical protein
MSSAAAETKKEFGHSEIRTLYNFTAGLLGVNCLKPDDPVSERVAQLAVDFAVQILLQQPDKPTQPAKAFDFKNGDEVSDALERARTKAVLSTDPFEKARGEAEMAAVVEYIERMEVENPEVLRMTPRDHDELYQYHDFAEPDITESNMFW